MSDNYAALREALALELTEGKRKHEVHNGGVMIGRYRLARYTAGASLPISDHANRANANARYAAATDPETIRALLAERDALAAERDAHKARLDRALKSAQEHFGENAIRYKFSLFKNGRCMNHFPAHIDGNWYALQRADDDAHLGLASMLAEAEAERDALRVDAERYRTLRASNQICGSGSGCGIALPSYQLNDAQRAHLDACVDGLTAEAARGAA